MKIGKHITVWVMDDLGYMPTSIDLDCYHKFKLLFYKFVKQENTIFIKRRLSTLLDSYVYALHCSSIRDNLPKVKYPNTMNKISRFIKNKFL